MFTSILFSETSIVSNLKLKRMFSLVSRILEAEYNLKGHVMTTFFQNKKYINNQTLWQNQWILVTIKSKERLINRITKFNTQDFLNANLHLRGNKDREPMLTTIRSMILFYLIYLFVKFIFIETICKKEKTVSWGYILLLGLAQYTIHFHS